MMNNFFSFILEHARIVIVSLVSVLAGLGAVIGIRYLDRDRTVLRKHESYGLSSNSFVISNVADEGEDKTYSQIVSTAFESKSVRYHLCLLLCEVVDVLSLEKIAEMITSNLITKEGLTIPETIEGTLTHFSDQLTTMIKGLSSMKRWGLGIMISDSKNVYWGIRGNLTVFSIKGSSIKESIAKSTSQTYYLKPREPFFLASYEFRQKEIRDIVQGVYKQFEDPIQRHTEMWKTLELKSFDYPKMSAIYLRNN